MPTGQPAIPSGRPPAARRMVDAWPTRTSSATSPRSPTSSPSRCPLPVDGAIPPALEGMLVRNGPNPAVRPRPGSLPLVQRRRHGPRRRAPATARPSPTATGGCAPASSRPRWARPLPWGPAEPIDGPANTHVIWHGGRLLALVECGLPHRLATSLATLEIEDFDGAPHLAHDRPPPRRPRRPGAWPSSATTYSAPPTCATTSSTPPARSSTRPRSRSPEATMQHDFGVTAEPGRLLGPARRLRRRPAVRRRHHPLPLGPRGRAPGSACSAGARRAPTSAGADSTPATPSTW